MAKPMPDPVLFLNPSAFLVVIGEAGAHEVKVPNHFTAAYSLDSGKVILNVEAGRGRVRVRSMTISENVEGEGVGSLTLGGIRLQRLLDEAVTKFAEFPGAGTKDVGHAVQRATRNRLTPERLQRVADAFRTGGINGIRKVDGEGSAELSERQAWRLKAKAAELGYLDDQEA